MPYDTAPGMRMAWDDDGSVAFAWEISEADVPSAPPTEIGASNKAEMNDEDNVDPSYTWDKPLNLPEGFHAVIFPELREIDGVFANASHVHGGGGMMTLGILQSSADTTSGIDGTWVTHIADIVDMADRIVYGNYRNEIVSLAINGARAIRIEGNDNFRLSGLHIYGEISPGETPDRLLFIDEDTGLEFALPVDYGDVPRGSARDFEWRLKNNSAVAGNNLTINTIQFTAESLYLNSGSWYTHSVGGDAFAGTKSIASLAPEAASSLIVTRQIIPVNEVLGVHAGRIQTTHTSLS